MQHVMLRSRRRRLLALALLALLVFWMRAPATAHADAAKLLSRFSSADATPVDDDESIVTIPSPRGDVRARLFLPRGVDHPPAVVLVHGVHYKGIEEPRLLRFSRSITSQGVAVLTPEIAELADYHVDPASIETVGSSIEWLKERSGRSKVGVMGMSFGGGISLLAAADPRFAHDVSFVVAVGAHDDLPRVARFFAHQPTPDAFGHDTAVKPHDYGATVLVYDRVEDFFPAEDRAAARDALRHWLREEQKEARADAERVTPASKEKLTHLFDGKFDAVDAELLAEIAKQERTMEQVSPHGHLDGLEAKVFILHGAGDTVIPATEATWLEKDVPPGKLAQVLVSPAIVHVEIDKEPTLAEKWALLHFMGEILETARGT
jgi:dienelactone hydrolase